MKKNILFIFLFLLFPLSVYADSINLDCPTEINSGSEFSCNVTGNTNSSVETVSAQIKLSSDLSLISFIPDKSIWIGDAGNNKIELYTSLDEGQKGTFKIGTLNLKSNGSNMNVVLDNVEYSGIDNQEYSISSVSKNIIIKTNVNNNSSNDNSNTTSNNDKIVTREEDNEENNLDNKVLKSAYLVDILVDGYTLQFDTNQFEYDLKINGEESLKINPVLEDSSAKYNVFGNNNLKNGDIITIEVTTDDNQKQVYKINILKEEQVEKKNYTLIFGIIIGLLILINIVRIILTKNKNK